MTLQDIVKKFGSLTISQTRQLTDEYGEFVVFNKDMKEWNSLFADTLGLAVKPVGEKPSSEDLKITEKFGGIFPAQTLFRKNFDDQTIIVMVWPWGDGKHTTFKIAVLAK